MDRHRLWLNRFDGRHFTPIYFRGPGSTPQGIVSSLAEGLDGDFMDWDKRWPRPHRTAALDRFDRVLIPSSITPERA